MRSYRNREVAQELSLKVKSCRQIATGSTAAPLALNLRRTSTLPWSILTFFIGALIMASFPLGLLADAEPHQSISLLTTANGYNASTYVIDDGSGRTHSINGFYDHIYYWLNPGRQTVDLCYDAFFGVRAGGQQTWCQSLTESEVQYLDGGIIHTVQSYGGIRIDGYYYAPFYGVPDSSSSPSTMLVMLCKITNTGSTSLQNNAIFALMNFHTGAGSPEPGDLYESITYNAAATTYVETSTDADHIMAYKAVPAPTRRSTSTDNPADNPWQVVADGGSLLNRDSIGTGEDRVCAYQWDIPNLAAGAEAWASVVVGYDNDNAEELVDALMAFVGQRTPQQLLVHERADWQSWFTGVEIPAGLTADETAVYMQQAAMLRMGQCREPNDGVSTPNGQITACLPPGMWSMTWVRDTSYAIQALTRMGLYAEARKALTFYLTGRTGDYREVFYQNFDYGAEVDYSISVCRYYGSGLEESDGGSDPNIEWDNFGLFLAAAGDYVVQSGDTAWLETNLDALDRRCGYVIERLISDNGLLKRDSSCWERHLSEALQYGYSSVTASWGLGQMAIAFTEIGELAKAARYAGVSSALKQAIMTHMVNNQSELIGAGNYPDYCDGAMTEAISYGFLHPLGTIAIASLAEFEQRLWIPTTNRGFQRLAGRPPTTDQSAQARGAAPGSLLTRDRDLYDSQEWIVIDMRMANSYRLAGQVSIAEGLIDWVTDQARANFDIIPELYDKTTANYDGAWPMQGFGAGAYVLALFARQPNTYAEIWGRITVDSPGGTGAGGAAIACLRDGSTIAATVSERDGYYRLAGLTPGPVTLKIRHESGVTETAEVHLTAGQIAILDAFVTQTVPAGYTIATGAPGFASKWTSGRKVGFGTARSDSRVWFTVGDGRLAEVAYPRVDLPQLKELRFIVTDGSSFCHDSTIAMTNIIEYVAPDAPLYGFMEVDPDNRYRIVWQPVPDPEGDVLYLMVKLEVMQGDPSDYHLYLLLDPHLKLAGASDTGSYVQDAGNELLLFSDRDYAFAFGATTGWEEFSLGYKGSPSDPLTDLCSGAPYSLTNHYYKAGPGNISAVVKPLLQGNNPIYLYLAFGRDPASAATLAQQARTRLSTPGFNEIRAVYSQQWQAYLNSTLDLSAGTENGGVLFKAARLNLACAEDKDYPGAVVASPSFAWGQDESEGKVTYQKVWARDLYHSASGFMAFGDPATALRCLEHLRVIQQEDNGSMPQHGHVDGYREPNQHEQYDETADAILLAWRLWQQEAVIDTAEALGLYQDFVKPAADFLVASQIETGQDRWEEEFGWAPATLAHVIGGLFCAAQFADLAGDSSSSASYLAKADYLENVIEAKTFTTSGDLGDGRYFVRIDQSGNPNDATQIEINSGGGWHQEKNIVSQDFLELVRIGVRSPYAQEIADSLPEVDFETSVEFPQGSGFHRYNHDGYGEKADGSTFLADPYFTGIGRVWPILSGERGHYTIARGIESAPYVAVMESFATDARTLSEQVWDSPDLPAQKLYRGEATNAACPLSWSAAEYLNLVRSRIEGEIYGLIYPVFTRYGNLPPRISEAVAIPSEVDNSGSDQTLLTVSTTDPEGMVLQVSVDLASLGGNEFQLVDDGTLGDPFANDNVWSAILTIPAVTTPGDYDLPCRAVDDLGAEATDTITLTVTDSGQNQAPMIIAGGYMASYLTSSGGYLQLWAVVLDPNGQSSIASVELLYDGASTGVMLYDDGQHDDGAAGDGVYSFALPLGGGLSPVAGLLFEVRAIDYSGAVASWPQLSVEW